MQVSRRTLLRGAAVTGAALAVPRWAEAARAVVPAGAMPFTQPLLVPPVLDATAGGAHSLAMTGAIHDFYPGSNTPVLHYVSGVATEDLNVLGPTIVARRGTPVSITMTNGLGAHPLADAIDTGLIGAVEADRTAPRAATHLHGGHTAPAFDGGPLDIIANGASFTYEYGNVQESAGLWYHDHALGITRLNVYAGLAGGYLIRDGDDDGIRFPAGAYEIPLVVQDRSFNADGTLAYPPGPLRSWAPEFFGDVATVNGVAWPTLAVEAGKYRFRVYNGSQSRFYNLKLVGRAGTAITFQQIGTDGGLLNAPVTLNALLLGPGERADLIVDFAGVPVGTELTMTNNARTPFPSGSVAGVRGGVPLREIMKFTVVPAVPGKTFTGAVPVPLRALTGPITPLAGRPVAATRTMALVEVLDPAGVPRMALLNDRPFMDEAGVPNTAYQGIGHRANTLEQWNIVNLTEDAHPIHLHLVQFQVLNRQRLDAEEYLAENYPLLPLEEYQSTYDPGDTGSPAADPGPFLQGRPRPPAANERGWKDTVVAMPGEVTRILVPLGADAVPGFPMAADPPPGGPYTGDYVWHCHILEHEENDMMQHYRVV